ncbi:MAG: ABC transporter permease [Acidimicrobiia bacterium]|nr:ABC transporter permease [Acidimicrobiia bacterium]
MLRFVVRRLARGAFAVATVLIVTFVLIQLAPGDAADTLAGAGSDEATNDYLRSYLQLDRPLWEQFGSYAANLARGDLGRSFVQGGTPVAELIGDRLLATLLLVVTALVFSSVGGILLGALMARWPNGSVDTSVSAVSLVAYAIPSFWLAQLFVLLFAIRAEWFPIQGMTDARADHTGWAAVADVAHHLVLPALVLGISQLALVARVTRSGLLGEKGKDYVRTARAKGATERRAILGHALPNAMLPVVTVIGTRLGLLFTYATVTETVFGWPGLGSLLLSASQSRDRPVLLGLVLLVSVSVVLANLATDMVYGWIDPRARRH